ncbi:hypothetical protein D3C80_1324660 [compost metagenome]
MSLQYSADREQQQNNDRRLKQRKGDIPDTLPFGSTIHVSRLINALVDPHNGSQIDYRSISQALPDLNDNNDDRPDPGGAVEIEFFHAQRSEHIIEYAIVKIEQVIDDGADNNHRDKIRHEHQRLRGFNEPFKRNFLKQHSHPDLAYITKNDECHIVENGIARQLPDDRVRPALEQKLEILQADERAQESFAEIIIGKSIVQPGKRQVVKGYKIGEQRDEHKIVGFVRSKVREWLSFPFKRFLIKRFRSGR